MVLEQPSPIIQTSFILMQCGQGFEDEVPQALDFFCTADDFCNLSAAKPLKLVRIKIQHVSGVHAARDHLQKRWQAGNEDVWPELWAPLLLWLLICGKNQVHKGTCKPQRVCRLQNVQRMLHKPH